MKNNQNKKLLAIPSLKRTHFTAMHKIVYSNTIYLSNTVKKNERKGEYFTCFCAGTGMRNIESSFYTFQRAF